MQFEKTDSCTIPNITYCLQTYILLDMESMRVHLVSNNARCLHTTFISYDDRKLRKSHGKIPQTN